MQAVSQQVIAEVVYLGGKWICPNPDCNTINDDELDDCCHGCGYDPCLSKPLYAGTLKTALN